MASPRDIEYYTRRAQDASQLARDARDSAVRTIHRKMADSYARLAGMRDISGSQRRS